MESRLRKGKLVTHVPCTVPACGSSDALAVYRQEDGSYNGTCFSCGHFEPNVPGYSSKVPAPIGEVKGVSNDPDMSGVRSLVTVEAVSKCPILPIPSRKISQATAEFYGVRTMLNGIDGRTPVAINFPYYIYNIYNSAQYSLTGYKKRLLEDKRFSFIGDSKDILLFGEQLFSSGGKRLYITEGEIDCLTLYQVLKESSNLPGYEPCVVSLPTGAQSVTSALSSRLKFLDKFKEIYLVFDQDEAGQDAVEKACSFLDLTKVKIVSFDLKDPNDMLMAGRSRELLWACLTGGKSYIPSGITTSKELLQDALKPSEEGLPWPWPALTFLTHGRRPGIYGIGAGVGIGKTEFFHELISHITYSEGRPVGVFLLEESPVRTLRIIAGKQLNSPIHRPDVSVDESKVEESIRKLSDPKELLFLFDHRGSRDWDTIFTQCKYLASVNGVRDIFIDPLTAIISHEENTDRALHKLMADIAVLAAAPYSCSVYYSSHLNEPPRDKTPHEEGGRVKESHFAGSRAMIRFSNYIFALERNKQDPDPVSRNTTVVRILKDRDFGNATGECFEIQYDPSTGRYLQTISDF
jgi:twinkle protein